MQNSTSIAAVVTWRGQRVILECTIVFVVDDHAKQAELKSGLGADPAWDFDYGTMFSRPICEVNVKEKPLEVANVEKKRRTT
jgi:hypothetical protein